jgi:hypothetical protein
MVNNGNKTQALVNTYRTIVTNPLLTSPAAVSALTLRA